jgi:4,5-DOPA dioxygenase extradiol
VDESRGLDHGAWVPLMLMYPDADIPVVQIGIQTPLGPEHHLRLGEALAPLRREDVLIVGSGSYTHNLRAMDRGRLNGPEATWSREFSNWVHPRLIGGGDASDLLAYRRLAPHGAHAHPSEEHFLPLFVALGAGGPGAKAERLHESATFGCLRMDAYAFR